MMNEVQNNPLELQDWHTLSSHEVLTNLGVAENGLSETEVKNRLEKYGYNQLTEAPRPGFLALLWDQLNDFVVMLLIVASIISIMLGEVVDAAAIMAIVVLRRSPGGAQENGRPRGAHRARWAAHLRPIA